MQLTTKTYICKSPKLFLRIIKRSYGDICPPNKNALIMAYISRLSSTDKNDYTHNNRKLSTCPSSVHTQKDWLKILTGPQVLTMKISSLSSQ